MVFHLDLHPDSTHLESFMGQASENWGNLFKPTRHPLPHPYDAALTEILHQEEKEGSGKVFLLSIGIGDGVVGKSKCCKLSRFHFEESCTHYGLVSFLYMLQGTIGTLIATCVAMK